jgi:opacity protein-like surface antigen
MTIRRSLALALRLLTIALTAGAQESAPPPIPYDLEVGFRILRVSGNEDMYRTQINERSGLLLRSFTLLTTDLGGRSSGLFDRFRVDAADIGAGPAGSLRIEADKGDLYRFRLGYRHVNAFSAFPGQHTYERTRNTFDADLDLLPNGRVTPFVGVSLHRSSGPGTTTSTLGGDEFRLSQDLDESEQEVRLGAAFRIGFLDGSATQGWRRTRGTERLTLAAADGGGNSADPLLGRPVLASGLTREDRARTNTPFTSLFVTGQAGTRVRLVGDFVRFAADSSGDMTEAAAGSFVSFALSRFFNGLSDTASSSTRNTTWRGGGRAEVALTDGITAFAGYRKEHRDLEGSALIDTLFLQTLTFGGIDPRDVQVILNAKSSIERDEDTINAGASARALGPFAVRVEFREAKQSLTVAPDLAEIVVPGSQGGDFERRVQTLDLNGSFTKSGFTFGVAVRHDRADTPIFRSDFRNRDRLRLRGAWKASKWIQAGVTAEATKQENAQPGIELDGKSRQASADVEVTPHEGVAFRASLSRFRADSSILIRHPENFNVDPSRYAEDGRSREGGVALNLAPVSFDVSAARFNNRGANPFDIHRIRVRAGFDLPAKTKSGLVAEYAQDKYRETSAGHADFDATRLGLFIRYRP